MKLHTVFPHAVGTSFVAKNPSGIVFSMPGFVLVSHVGPPLEHSVKV